MLLFDRFELLLELLIFRFQLVHLSFVACLQPRKMGLDLGQLSCDVRCRTFVLREN